MWSLLFLFILKASPYIIICALLLLSRSSRAQVVDSTLRWFVTQPQLLKKVNIADSISMFVTPKQVSDSGFLKRVAFTGAAVISMLGYTPLNGADTASLSSRVNLKMNTSDTSSISNRINSKLNTSDTSSLSNRVNSKLNVSDTSSLSGRINTKFTSPSGTTGQYLRGDGTLSVLPVTVDTTSLSNRINAVTPQNIYNAGYGVIKTGSDPTASFKVDTAAIMYTTKATATVNDIMSNMNGKVDKSTTLSINSVTQDLSTSRGWTIPTVSSVSGTSPIAVTGTGTPTVSINNGKADDATKGAVTMDSLYFNDNGSGWITWSLDYGTGTTSANAVTINKPRGRITIASPSILAGTTLSITFTNSFVATTSTISLQIGGNGSSLSLPLQCYVKSQTAGSCVINFLNISLLSTFNTGIVIDYVVIN